MGNHAPSWRCHGALPQTHTLTRSYMVLRPRRHTTLGYRNREHRVRDRGEARGGGSTRGAPEVGHSGIQPRDIANAGDVLQAEDNQQVQEVLEIVPPSSGVCMLGCWGGQCFSRVSVVGRRRRRRRTWHAPLLPVLVSTDWSMCGSGGQLLDYGLPETRVVCDCGCP
ncbi:unnamed protein product [Cuscuta europaea]|uniref:Uncharacterized protein n=1 Tax=Cuscuta europaea TaxID=41803 RepID=A0A9P0Z4Z1_CUSEU|nr:unnamed protein product [Cuscuta europaea]